MGKSFNENEPKIFERMVDSLETFLETSHVRCSNLDKQVLIEIIMHKPLLWNQMELLAFKIINVSEVTTQTNSQEPLSMETIKYHPRMLTL